MTLTIDMYQVLSLFSAMALLAAVPSVSVLAVTARASSLGFLHGGVTALGIVAGDIVFIALAITGLSVLAERAGGFWYIIQFSGACYLVVLGVKLWRADVATLRAESPSSKRSYASSFLSGLALTLGDQKAILFYLGFFPAFLDLQALTRLDVIVILLTTLFSVLGVKLVYAGMAGRLGRLLGYRMGRWMNRIAGAVIMGVGVYIVLR